MSFKWFAQSQKIILLLHNTTFFQPHQLAKPLRKQLVVDEHLGIFQIPLKTS